VPGVLKEMTVFAIVYNLVRMGMWQSATLQHTAVERISFLDAQPKSFPLIIKPRQALLQQLIQQEIKH
jgi:hypothetical protein